MIRRPPRSTRKESSAASDVYKRQMFGHAYKGQPDGQKLLSRFAAGGGILYDLEYLTDETGRRVAAFGYWAGFAGAAVAIKSWSAAQLGER